MKIAIIIFSDTTTVEGLGKVSNAFMFADEAVAHGDELQLLFSGAGVKWIGELETEDHKLHKKYNMLKKYIGSCLFCAKAFGVKIQTEQADIKLVGDYKEHISYRSLLSEGYQIITF